MNKTKIIQNIPNILTIIRILLIPFIIISILNDEYIMALIFFLLSGTTDILDGFIARKFNLITNLGKLLDPLADKLTQISTLVTITVKGIIPYWILLIIFSKEILMVCGASFLYGKDTVVSSKWFGKLSTVVLYIAIFLSIVIIYFNLPNEYIMINMYIYILAIISTVFSLIMYFKTFYSKDLLNKNKAT